MFLASISYLKLIFSLQYYKNTSVNKFLISVFFPFLLLLLSDMS